MPRGLDTMRGGVPMEEGALAKRTKQPSGKLDAKLEAEPTIEQQLAALDTAGLRDNMADRDATKATKQQSLGGTMLKPESLIKLGLAVAGMASGNQDLQGLGMALGSGTLKGAAGYTDEYNDQRQKQIDDLTKMVDKQQQRLVTLLQSQPGLFLDKQGQNLIKPGEWSELLELGVPINVEGLVQAATRTAGQAERATQAWKFISEGRAANNSKMVGQGVAILNETYGLDMSPELQLEFTKMNDGNMYETLTKLYTIDSVALVMNDYHTKGIDPYSPEQYDKLIAKPLEGLTDTPAGIKLKKGIDAQMFLQKYIDDGHQADWENDPSGTIKDAFIHDAVGYGDLLAFAPFYGTGEERETSRLKEMQRAFADNMQLAITMAGIEGDDDAIKQLMYARGQQSRQLEEMALGINRNATSTQSVRRIGATLISKHPYVPAQFAEDFGVEILARAKELASARGYTWNEVPQADKDALLMWSIDTQAAQFKESNPEIQAALDKQRAAAEAGLKDKKSAADKPAPLEDAEIDKSTLAPATREEVAGTKRLDAMRKAYDNRDGNIVIPKADLKLVDVFEEFRAMSPADQRALANQPKYAEALDFMSSFEQKDIGWQELGHLARTLDSDEELLRELRSRPVENQDALARGNPAYADALQRERDRRRMDPDKLLYAVFKSGNPYVSATYDPENKGFVAWKKARAEKRKKEGK